MHHIKPATVYHIVEVAPALFPHTKTVNAFGGIASESLQFPAIRTGTREFDIQTPVQWRLGWNFAALEQEFRRARPEMPDTAVNRRCRLPASRTDPFDRGNDQGHGTVDFGAQGDLLSGRAAESPALEAL